MTLSLTTASDDYCPRIVDSVTVGWCRARAGVLTLGHVRSRPSPSLCTTTLGARETTASLCSVRAPQLVPQRLCDRPLATRGVCVGTTSYFVATVTSSVAMTHAYAEEVSILSGRALDNQDKATASSAGTAWVLPTAAPAGTTPRQVSVAAISRSCVARSVCVSAGTVGHGLQ